MIVSGRLSRDLHSLTLISQGKHKGDNAGNDKGNAWGQTNGSSGKNAWGGGKDGNGEGLYKFNPPSDNAGGWEGGKKADLPDNWGAPTTSDTKSNSNKDSADQPDPDPWGAPAQSNNSNNGSQNNTNGATGWDYTATNDSNSGTNAGAWSNQPTQSRFSGWCSGNNADGSTVSDPFPLLCYRWISEADDSNKSNKDGSNKDETSAPTGKQA